MIDTFTSPSKFLKFKTCGKWVYTKTALVLKDTPSKTPLLDPLRFCPSLILQNFISPADFQRLENSDIPLSK